MIPMATKKHNIESESQRGVVVHKVTQKTKMAE